MIHNDDPGSSRPFAANAAPTSHPGQAALADFQVSSRVLLLIVMAAVVGLMGTAAAWALTRLIALATNIAYFGHWSFASVAINHTPLGFERILVPAVGGLIIGLLARYGSEKIRGHGIPEAIEAILIGNSRIQPKVAILKPLSSAISIGTGGPFGAEGPVIMTGGALGSLFAQLFHLTSVERKTLLVAGAAAGMTGIFGTPVAALVLAVEMLLFEWRPRSFLPVAMAVVVAALARSFVFASPPLFPYAASVSVSVRDACDWLGIGIVSGLGSALLTGLVYGTEDAFAKLPVHWMWWPAISGLVVGVGGLIEPAALGVGYENLQAMLDGQFAMRALLLLLFVKAVIWAVALGSGTSGGVLAPLLMIGGALGAIIGVEFSPAHATLFALLGMAAMMGGTMRSPLTATIFAVELTGNVQVLLPLMTACVAAHAVTVLLLKRSILTERIARRGLHIMREYSVDPFDMARVKDVMVANVDTLSAAMTIESAIAFFTTDEHRHKTYPVLSERNQVLGMVSRADILRWMVSNGADVATLGDAVADENLLTAHPDELAGSLADRMAQADIGRVPVVDAAQGKLVGIVARKDLLRVRARMLMHEKERSAPLRRGRAG